MTSSSTGTCSYLYRGDNLLAEVDTAEGVVTQYTYYDGIDAPQSVLYHGTTYYMARELPGNVTALTTANSAGTGTIAASWDYDLWGVPTTTSGADSIPMPFKFGAREYDAETGLYYNRARYYDPSIGRFLSEDPIGLAGGINQYAYAGNNPTNATDPSGLFCVATRTVSTGIVTGTVYSDITTLSPECWGGGGGGGGFTFGPRPGGIPWGEVGFGGPIQGGGGSDRVRSPSSRTPTQPGPWPTCSSVTFPGSHGAIYVQTHPNGTVAWGIYMYYPAANDGPWIVNVMINGRRVDGKAPPRQDYPPHGSISPFQAKKGSLLTFDATHSDLSNRLYRNVPNGCVIP